MAQCDDCGSKLEKNVPQQSGVAHVIYECPDCDNSGFYSEVAA